VRGRDIGKSGGVSGRWALFLDARRGRAPISPLLRRKLKLPDSIQSGIISYAAAGRQYVAVAAGHTLFAFALPR
jgi:hypothetical protein